MLARVLLDAFLEISRVFSLSLVYCLYFFRSSFVSTGYINASGVPVMYEEIFWWFDGGLTVLKKYV